MQKTPDFGQAFLLYEGHEDGHGDHAEAVNSFKDLSGAKTVIGRFDFEKAKKYFENSVIGG